MNPSHPSVLMIETVAQGDFRTSHDIEDVVTLLDGLLTFDLITQAKSSVKSYLRRMLDDFMQQDLFLESITTHLEPGPSNPDRAKRILELFRSL